VTFENATPVPSTPIAIADDHSSEPVSVDEFGLVTEAGEQIALYVSVDTVKSHVSAIFRKLDATSRSDAVAAAHACSLPRPQRTR